MSARLSALDAAFLRVERDVQPVHVGFVLLLAGPAPATAELCAVLATRLPRRLRRVVVGAPLDLRRPRWRDADVDLAAHVHRHDLTPAGTGPDPATGWRGRARPAAAGAPAGTGEDERRLQDAVAALLEPALPRDRPLWDLHVLTGWDGGDQPRWAVLVRAHHALVDGLAGVDALVRLLDPPAGDDPGPGGQGPERPLPGLGQASLSGATGRRALAGVGALARAVGPPERALSGSLSPRRQWRWARGDLRAARAAAEALGSSVNDVVLGCVTGGLRELMLSRGDRVDGRTLRALVPVSLRTPTERGAGGNLVSGVVARLPVGEADPVRRVRLLHRQLRELTTGPGPLGPVALLRAVERTPEPLAAALQRSAARWRHGWTATATTNVPGPAGARSLAGRALLEAFPCIPLGQRMRVTVGILSAGEHLHCGITTDAVHLPGADVVAAGTERAWTDLGGMIRA